MYAKALHTVGDRRQVRLDIVQVVTVEDDDTVDTLTERIKAAERPQLADLVGRMVREGFTVTDRKVTIP